MYLLVGMRGGLERKLYHLTLLAVGSYSLNTTQYQVCPFIAKPDNNTLEPERALKVRVLLIASKYLKIAET